MPEPRFFKCLLAEKLHKKAADLERRVRRARKEKQHKTVIADFEAKLLVVYKDLDIHIFELGCDDCKRSMA